VLEHNESARLVGDGARALFENAGGIGRARQRREHPVLDRAVWDEMAALGWFGMLVPEADGGCGFTMTDTIELLEAMGAALAPEPVPLTLAAVSAIAALNSDEARALRNRIMAGHDIPFIAPLVELSVQCDRLSGRTGTHADLHLANTFLIGAQLDNESMLLAAAPGVAGFTIATVRTVDGGSAGHLLFDDVNITALRVLARGSAAETVLRDAADIARLCRAAILVGLMDRVLAITVDYLKTRVQFGVPIGSFQAVQHRAASAHVDVASSRSLVREAVRAVGTARQTRAAAAAKAYVSNAAMRVTHEAIQLHGAIGFTDEHDIGLYHRRAMALVAADGGVAAARRVWAEAHERAEI
jgi:alkylation response protein AidB-like acyl-CoA dehydrogenase